MLQCNFFTTQKINIAQHVALEILWCKLKTDIQHQRYADDLRTGFEVAKGYRIGHVAEINFQDAVGQGGLF